MAMKYIVMLSALIAVTAAAAVSTIPIKDCGRLIYNIALSVCSFMLAAASLLTLLYLLKILTI